ncbi:MAG: hypothetical protein HY300_17370 [Verrucomicrobia bacterium]|nr:hypothetical protein [Verrucomicrobiota bacterium]
MNALPPQHEEHSGFALDWVNACLDVVDWADFADSAIQCLSNLLEHLIHL